MAKRDTASPGVEVRRKSRWGWMGPIGLLLAVGAPLVALLMALATGAGMIDYTVSLGSLRYLVIACAIGLVLVLIVAIIALVKKRWRAFRWLVPAFVIGGGFIGYLLMQLSIATSVPPIHDVTTDLENPPEFVALTLRDDNLDVVPPGEDPRMEAMTPVGRWALYHSEAYGDLDTIVVPTNVPDTVSAAQTLIAERGWELAEADAASGRVEATDTVSLYGFKDDIVLRIVPNADGPGSLVDMRSVSRVGVSDLGVNAERVREFLADLSEATGG
ncbi:MAG: DUF1499 domain-containing protein [Parasphingopyxis sp.]|uniref:DUF1499 domain-containing protein n=1 Tax=Parasphingopyxis sp. TaxID=1920299 RepID=UPI0032EE8F49